MTFPKRCCVLLASALYLVIAGCMGLPTTEIDLHQRSMQIQSEEDEKKILERASLKIVQVPGATPVRVLYLQGTPYEMGFQHGALLREDIHALYRSTLGKVRLMIHDEMLSEVYALMAPYIGREEQEEMRGLAHGSGLPIAVVHWLHSIPELSEYGGKNRFSRGFSDLSCSNVAAFGSATGDGELYHLRVLDWARGLGVQQWPTVLVHQPEEGFASVTFSYAGFIGSVVGMNARQLTLGEMGYGNPEGESLEGVPFPLLFRQLLRESSHIDEVTETLARAVRTNSYVYVAGDGKEGPEMDRARLYVTDRQRLIQYPENTLMVDTREKGDTYLPVDDLVYGSAKGDLLYQELTKYHGRIGAESLKRIASEVALKSNLMNVIMKPATFEAWVSNATLESGDAGRAIHQPWIHLDFSDVLGR